MMAKPLSPEDEAYARAYLATGKGTEWEHSFVVMLDAVRRELRTAKAKLATEKAHAVKRIAWLETELGTAQTVAEHLREELAAEKINITRLSNMLREQKTASMIDVAAQTKRAEEAEAKLASMTLDLDVAESRKSDAFQKMHRDLATLRKNVDAVIAEMRAADDAAGCRAFWADRLASVQQKTTGPGGTGECSKPRSETSAPQGVPEDYGPERELYGLDDCTACGKPLRPENYRIADGCPCNSGRGVNHGLVARRTCTCTICDPDQTGSTRYPVTESPDWRALLANLVNQTGVRLYSQAYEDALRAACKALEPKGK